MWHLGRIQFYTEAMIANFSLEEHEQQTSGPQVVYQAKEGRITS